MPYSELLLRALAFSIPIGLVIGLMAGYVRRRLADRLVKKHPSGLERLKQAIYATGILVFTVLGSYCFFVIEQPTFGSVYVLMSVLNLICLARSLGRDNYDENGVPRRHYRKPKRVTPIVDLQPKKTGDLSVADH